MFKCMTCGAKFWTQRGWLAHMRRTHGNRV